MKRLFLIILTVFLLHGQWSNLEHAYHDHAVGEVCVSCLSTQSLDHALFSSFQNVSVTKEIQRQDRLTLEFIARKSIRTYVVRAPPRLI